MEIHLKVCFSCLIHLAIHISIAGADFSMQPDLQTSACFGKDRLLDWTINNEASINTVAWSFNTVVFALKAGSGGTATYTGSTGITAAQVEHTTSGKIVIKNSDVADAGEYSCRVTYTGASGFAAASSTATVAVIVTAPPDPTLTTTGDTYTCSCDSTSVTVTIKVDNEEKTTNAYTGSVDSTVECCITGDTVPCMSDTSDTKYCKLLFTVTPPPAPPSGDNVPLIVGICVAVVVVLIIIISVCCCIRISRKRNKAKEKQIHNRREDTNDYEMENNEPTVELQGAAVIEDNKLCDTAAKNNDGLVELDNTTL